MMPRLLPAALAASSFLVNPATAQQGLDLGELVLSGGLSPVSQDALARSATVITADEIEARNLATVTEVLKAVPGLSVSSSGSSSSQVRIRGGEANHALILIDGVRLAGGDSNYLLSGLEATLIERIEVLRGPQSVFYGSNASSGVVNIITRKGGIGEEGSASVRFGNGATGTLFLSSRGERGGLSLSFGSSNDAGYDVSGSDGEEDDTRRTTLSLAADGEVLPGLTLGATLRRADENRAFDSTNGAATRPEDYVVDNTAPFSDSEERTASAFVEYAPDAGIATHRLFYELTRNTLTTDSGFGPGAPIETEVEAFGYLGTVSLNGSPVAASDQVVNLMLETETDSSSTNPAYERETDSVALEYRGRFGAGLDLQAGLRHDSNDQFEDITNWTVSAGYTLPSGIRLHASAGTGSVDPTYFELFDNDFGSIYLGNPDLRPELNRGFDIGVEVPFAQGRGVVDITYFDETLEDEIETVFIGTDPVTNVNTFTFRNQAGDSTRQGVELAAQLAATDAIDLRLNYTYLDARNPDESVEIRRPRHELLLGGTWRSGDGRASVSTDIRHVADLRDTQFFGAFATESLPDYTTVDLSARYRLDDLVTAEARVSNLFDADQMDVWGYAGPPRVITIGLSADF